MTSPIRTVFYTVTDLPDDCGTWTLRQAAEWYKGVIRAGDQTGMLTELENKYVNERWAHLMNEISKCQKVPAGMLSYFVGELAQTEIKLHETAQQEAAAAMEYGV